MPEEHKPIFDHETSLEDLTRVGGNRRFDDFIDDQEDEQVRVVCRSGGDEIAVAKPSRAVYCSAATSASPYVREDSQVICLGTLVHPRSGVSMTEAALGDPSFTKTHIKSSGGMSGH